MSTGSVAASYRGLFAEPVLRRLAVADVCARLPQGMVSITLLLVVAQHASMAVAGLVVAGYTLGQAVTGPVRGRLADRRGLIPVAVACGTGYALALLALLGGALVKAPAGLLIGVAAVAGLVNPPLSPGMRSLWSAYAAARFTSTAFALDAAVFDLAYITGPVLASALATGIAPAAALGLLLVLTGAAVAVIGRQAWPPGAPAGAELPSLASAPVERAAQVAGDGGAGQRGGQRDRGRADRLRPAPPRPVGLGPLLAEVSIGSILAPLLAVAAPLAGFCLGPTLATLFSTAASAAPRGGGIQTQAWLNSIMNGGAAAGAALAGLAAGRPILALAAALAAAAAAAATAAITGARTITRAHSAPRSVERETAPGRSGPRLRRQAHQEVRR